MPIYEFRCKDCGEKFEALCRMGRNPVRRSDAPGDGARADGDGLHCPSCSGDHITRLMSTFAARVSGRSEPSASSACSSCSSKSCAT